MQLICSHCHTAYSLPEIEADGRKVRFDVMHVVSDPFREGERVWFWCREGPVLYLNLSCKGPLDMVFLRAGQNISAEGTIRRIDVHVRWKCPEGGEVMEINERVPCLVNDSTRIELMRVS